jgi:hypothetical protein
VGPEIIDLYWLVKKCGWKIEYCVKQKNYYMLSLRSKTYYSASYTKRIHLMEINKERNKYGRKY